MTQLSKMDLANLKMLAKMRGRLIGPAVAPVTLGLVIEKFGRERFGNVIFCEIGKNRVVAEKEGLWRELNPRGG